METIHGRGVLSSECIVDIVFRSFRIQLQGCQKFLVEKGISPSTKNFRVGDFIKQKLETNMIFMYGLKVIEYISKV